MTMETKSFLQDVSVSVVDLVGFSNFTEDYGPEEMVVRVVLRF